MALGRWKQRAISLESLESTDTLLPDDDEVSVPKRPRVKSGTKTTTILAKCFVATLDEDRPSSGDSGISSDNQSEARARLGLPNEDRATTTNTATPPTATTTTTTTTNPVPRSAKSGRGLRQEASLPSLTAVDLSKTGYSKSGKTSSELSFRSRASLSSDNGEDKENNDSAHGQGGQKGALKHHRSKLKAAKEIAPAPVNVLLDSQENCSSPTPSAADTVETADSMRLRRIEANARERTRVHTIGAAFDALRHAVPSNCDQQKLSKLAVLRIAAAYIRSLAALAKEDPDDFATGVSQVTQALYMDGARAKAPRSNSAAS